jgi:hypothetical protein
MTTSFLSIDLDYWTDLPEKDMISFLKKIKQLDLPIKPFIEHHEMLKYINRYDFDILYNIDYHSDIVDQPETCDLELNEGTWANFVKKKYERTFIWIHPKKSCYMANNGYAGDGRCDMYENPFTQDVSGWWNVKHRKAKLLTEKELETVRYIGITVSPDWTPVDKACVALDYLNEVGLISDYFYNKAIHLLEKKFMNHFEKKSINDVSFV